MKIFREAEQVLGRLDMAILVQQPSFKPHIFLLGCFGRLNSTIYLIETALISILSWALVTPY